LAVDKNSRERFETYCGMDLGDKKSQVVLLEGDSAEVVEEGKIATTQRGLERSFGGRERMMVIIEAGTLSPWVMECLQGLGHEVVVAEATRAGRLMKGHKTDREDAEALARWGRSDPKLLRPIQHRSREAREALAVIRSRDAAVAARPALINHVCGSVKLAGYRLPS